MVSRFHPRSSGTSSPIIVPSFIDLSITQRYTHKTRTSVPRVPACKRNRRFIAYPTTLPRAPRPNRSRNNAIASEHPVPVDWIVRYLRTVSVISSVRSTSLDAVRRSRALAAANETTPVRDLVAFVIWIGSDSRGKQIEMSRLGGRQCNPWKRRRNMFIRISRDSRRR